MQATILTSTEFEGTGTETANFEVCFGNAIADKSLN